MKVQKIISLSIATLLSLGLLVPSLNVLAAEEEKLPPKAEETTQPRETIRIKTEDDWERLAENCRLDTWSENKIVILDNDLKLSKCTPIPSFSGIFDGNNKKIERLDLSGDADRQGLFRYIREGGEIKNLTLVGSVSFVGDYAIGGFAGINQGLITNCNFKGFVYGGSSIGGIAGVNEETGTIKNCTSMGGVQGEHYTGGIVGENYGTVLNCDNNAEVNTEASEISTEIESVDWEKVNDTENLPACTDTGGIAGYSTGFMQNCINNALIGYAHVGYNVGGIVGRQSGFVGSCTNNGKVQGRKDVGGIVGQAEPYMLLHYEEDTLQKLADELEAMNDLLSATIDEGNSTRNDVSDELTGINKTISEIQDVITSLIDELEEVGEGTVDTVNELSDRVAKVLDDAVPVSESTTSSLKHLSQAVEHLTKAMEATENMDEQMGGINNTLDSAMSSLNSALSQSRAASQKISDALSGLNSSSSEEDLRAALQTVKSAMEEMNNASATAGQALSTLQNILPQLNGVWGSVGNATPEVKKSTEEIKLAMDDLAVASADLSGMIKEQAELPNLEIPKVSEDFHERQDNLGTLLTKLNDQMEAMNRNADMHGDKIYGDLKGINARFENIADIIRDANKDRELMVDISEENISDNTPGKIQGCINNCEVDGDVNVGGIAGAMAIEFDFDPEDDVRNHEENSLDFQYLLRDILHNSINKGAITARKDYAGGIIGRMDNGVTLNCQSYGPVKSTGGKYVGGIAGSSEATIRDSFVKCELSGMGHLGGIGGYIKNVKNCNAFVNTEDNVSYMGAIGGELDEEGNVENNFFVDGDLAGIDGISYSKKAEPLEYSEFIKRENLPQEFEHLVVLFTLDDKTIEAMLCDYGGSIDKSLFPSLPERDGFYVEWSEFDNENILFDTEVKAKYLPYITAISSRNGLILAEGTFTEKAELHVAEQVHELPEWVKKHGEVYSIVLQKSQHDFNALRVKIPQNIRYPEMLIFENNEWHEIPSEQDGNYLRAEYQGSTAEICITEDTKSIILWSCIIGFGGALIISLIVILIVRHRKKAKAEKKTIQNESSPEEVNKE